MIITFQPVAGIEDLYEKVAEYNPYSSNNAPLKRCNMETYTTIVGDPDETYCKFFEASDFAIEATDLLSFVEDSLPPVMREMKVGLRVGRYDNGYDDAPAELAFSFTSPWEP